MHILYYIGEKHATCGCPQGHLHALLHSDRVYGEASDDYDSLALARDTVSLSASLREGVERGRRFWLGV